MNNKSGGYVYQSPKFINIVEINFEYDKDNNYQNDTNHITIYFPITFAL